MLITTLMADGLSQADVAAASDALRGAGGEPGAVVWIDDGAACDVAVSGIAAASARAALEAALPRLDIVVQTAAGSPRRKRLLIADMDSTMITCECIDELADYAGLKAEVAAVTEAAMRGELDFEAALDARVALLAGMDAAVIDRCRAERVRLMPGAVTLVRTMRDSGAHTLLVSGGFTAFAEPVAAAIGFAEVRANTLSIAAGRLTGAVARPIVDAAAKRAALLAAATARGVPLAATLAVGDGATDIPMLEAAGLGIAYHAKPKAAAAAAAAISHGNLTTLLWAQGYARREWLVSP